MSQHLIHSQTIPSCVDHRFDIRLTHPYLSPQPPYPIRSTLSGLWEADGFGLGESLQVVFCAGPTQFRAAFDPHSLGAKFHPCTGVVNLSRWIWGFPYSSSSSYCSANACRSWMIWRALITPCTALWGGIHWLKTFQSFKLFHFFSYQKDTYLAFLHLLVYKKQKDGFQ